MRLSYKQLFNKKYGFKLNEPHDLKEISKKYRQELRDITENLVVEIDMDIKWPTKPS